MKRTRFIPRKAPLKAKVKAWWEKVRSPIKKRNAKRTKAAFEEDFGPPGFSDFVRETGCVVANQSGSTAECIGPVQHCHRKSRGAGGGWKNNSFGGCLGHHNEQHMVGIKTFERMYGLDLDLECCAITHSWERKRYGW